MRIGGTVVLLMACVLGASGDVFAQAIAGAVSDASGAALTDVAVKAESSALIEKTRTVVTDRNGQYRIEDLRPGVYTVTFVREGFQPQAVERVAVTAAFTASVSAQLVPGGLAETITVTREVPVVDVRSAAAATTLHGHIVRSLPTVRSYNALVVLIPGVSTTTNDVVTGTSSTPFPIRGGRGNEGRLSIDGLVVGGASIGNSRTSYVVDAGATEEVTFVGA